MLHKFLTLLASMLIIGYLGTASLTPDHFLLLILSFFFGLMLGHTLALYDKK